MCDRVKQSALWLRKERTEEEKKMFSTSSVELRRAAATDLFKAKTLHLANFIGGFLNQLGSEYIPGRCLCIDVAAH